MANLIPNLSDLEKRLTKGEEVCYLVDGGRVTTRSYAIRTRAFRETMEWLAKRSITPIQPSKLALKTK